MSPCDLLLTMKLIYWLYKSDYSSSQHSAVLNANTVLFPLVLKHAGFYTPVHRCVYRFHMYSP